MRGTFGRVGRWVARSLTRKFCAEVLVSSLATIAVTLLYSGSHLKPEPDLQPIPEASSLARQASFAADARHALPGEHGLLPLGYPVQFEAQFSVRQSLATARAGWSRALPPETRAAQAPGVGCGSECGERSLPIVLAVLPPERPPELKPQVLATAAAMRVMGPPASLMRSSSAPEQRPHILGMPLPRFIPVGEKVMGGVTMLGHRIIDLVPSW